MNLNRTVIAFPNNMEVFLPSLKKKWANYLLLSNNKKPKEVQRYELHIPDSIPNEVGEDGDTVVWETEHINFEGVLIGTNLVTTQKRHIGTMLFKTDLGIHLIHCIQTMKYTSDVSYEHIYGTNVFEILKRIKVNQVDLDFIFKTLLPETANLSLRDQVLTAIKTFFRLEKGIYLGEFSKGYIAELHLLGIKVILQMTMTNNGLKLDKTLVFNSPQLKIDNINPDEVSALIDLEHLSNCIKEEFK